MTIPDSLPRRYPAVSTSIEMILRDNLPTEYSGVLAKINSLNEELHEYQAYQAYLIRIAEASEICLVEDSPADGRDSTDRQLSPQE